MEFLIVGLVLTAGAALTGGIAIIAYRQKALEQLKGSSAPGFDVKVKNMASFIYRGIAKTNKRLTISKRYNSVYFNLKKLNMEDNINREDFLFAEQLCAFIVLGAAFAAGFGIMFSAALAAAVFFLPWLVLKAKVRKKENDLLTELPDALDIIAANIEGGLSLNMALSRYASRNRNVFSEELLNVQRKIQLGVSFEAAMRELDKKMEMKEITSFVNAFLQADRMGGNVKKIIKDQAEEVRKKRFQHLKKLAHEAPVKLLIPLMLFIFPVIFIVLFGPIIIKLMQGL